MKFTNIAIYILLLSPLICIGAQTPIISTSKDFNDFLQSDQNFLLNKRPSNEQIEGSPYVEEAFIEGALKFRNKKYLNVLLRFNLYNGYFEYMTDSIVKYIDPKYNEVDTVWYNNQKYIYIPYQEFKNLKKDYMVLLYEGPTELYEYNEIMLLEAKAAEGYSDPKPARFYKRPSRYFIKLEDKPAIEIKNKKSIYLVFDKHVRLIKSYIKSEKLKVKTANELIQVCTYYDSIK